MSKRPYSFSQLNCFISCPQAYYLHYIKGVQSIVNENVTAGAKVHEELEHYPECSEDVKEFSDALGKFLKDDEIVASEESFYFKINGHDFIAKIDAVTKEKYIIDYKITSAPSYYAKKVGYQLPLYRLAVGEGSPVYLLFKVSRTKNKETGETDIKFLQLFVQEVDISDDLLERKTKYISRIVDMIELCKTDEIFPPSYNDCNRCFYKHACSYFGG